MGIIIPKNILLQYRGYNGCIDMEYKENIKGMGKDIHERNIQTQLCKYGLKLTTEDNSCNFKEFLTDQIQKSSGWEMAQPSVLHYIRQHKFPN